MRLMRAHILGTVSEEGGKLSEASVTAKDIASGFEHYPVNATATQLGYDRAVLSSTASVMFDRVDNS
jgi:hypothetical protein